MPSGIIARPSRTSLSITGWWRVEFCMRYYRVSELVLSNSISIMQPESLGSQNDLFGVRRKVILSALTGFKLYEFRIAFIVLRRLGDLEALIFSVKYNFRLDMRALAHLLLPFVFYNHKRQYYV